MVGNPSLTGLLQVCHFWACGPRNLMKMTRRWTLPRSHPLASIPSSLLPPHPGAPTCVSRQVRRRSQVGLSAWPASSFRESSAAHTIQDLRFLAETAVPKGLDRLLQITLWRPRICAPVSRPLHPPRGHLQPSPGLVCQRPGHLSLARLGGSQPAKLMTVSLDEFLRRFLLHLLPKGFVRIRHFGLLANCRRSTLLPLCLAALGTVPSQIEPETSSTQESEPLWRCPKCGGPMAVIERLTAAQIQ